MDKEPGVVCFANYGVEEAETAWWTILVPDTSEEHAWLERRGSKSAIISAAVLARLELGSTIEGGRSHQQVSSTDPPSAQ